MSRSSQEKQSAAASLQNDGVLPKDDEDVSSIEKGLSTTQNHNEIIIAWEDDNDPAKPTNWSQHKKVSMVALVSALGFLT